MAQRLLSRRLSTSHEAILDLCKDLSDNEQLETFVEFGLNANSLDELAARIKSGQV